MNYVHRTFHACGHLQLMIFKSLAAGLLKKNMYGNFIVSYDRNHKDIYTDDRQRKLLTWLCDLYEDYIIDVLQ